MVSDNGNQAKQPDANTEGKLRRRNGVIGRIRTMRSNVQMRSQPVPPESEQPKLRRMKTLTSLSSRSDSFSALKGKSLETLARLGGHSFLELPKDFVPALLKLPVCFAATAGYLRCHCRQPSFYQTRPDPFTDSRGVRRKLPIYGISFSILATPRLRPAYTTILRTKSS